MKWKPHRRATRLLRLTAAPLAFAMLGRGISLAGTPDSYTGMSGGNWSVGTNWSAGEPNSSSDVTISGNIAVYFNVTGSTTIDSLGISSGAVLNLNAGSNLTASNNAALSSSYLNSSSTFSAPATTSANGMQLSASAGGSISLAALTHIDSLGMNPSLQASGTGSLVSLAALTSATMTSNLYFQASSGGDVEAPNLNSLSFPNSGEYLALYSTGSGSMVDVAALGGISLQNLYVQVHTGGAVNWGSPTSVQNSILLLDTAGTLNTASLTNIDGTQLTSTNGATFSLPVTSYNAGSANPQWQATNANSKLILPNLTSITTNSNFELLAQSGGDIEVPKLSTVTYISGGFSSIDFNLQAVGANSIINASGLNPSLTDLYVVVRTGGTVNWGSPTSVTNSTLTMDTAGTLNTASLTNIDGTQLTSTNGATFSLPVTSYNAGSSNPQWQATNANSKLLLPNLTSITTNSNFGLTAQSGGDIEVPKLSSVTYIPGGVASIDLSLQAIGTNSLINVSGLSPSLSTLYVVVRTGGTVNWGSPTSVANSTLTMDTSGTLNTAALSHIDGTSLTATNGATFSLPAVTSFVAGNNAPQWQSTNASSILTVSQLNTLTSNSNFGLSAQNGGTINLPALTSMSFGSSGDLYVQSGGTNSVVNLSGLLSTGSSTNSALLTNGGQILLGAPGQVANVSFLARFNNANGPLVLYENGAALETIEPNNLGTFESYNFSNLPAAGDLELLASGNNSSVTVESYQIAAVPEPSLAGAAMLTAGVGLIRRSGRRRPKKSRRLRNQTVTA